jgi:hypothetical protein
MRSYFIIPAFTFPDVRVVSYEQPTLVSVRSSLCIKNLNQPIHFSKFSMQVELLLNYKNPELNQSMDW